MRKNGRSWFLLVCLLAGLAGVLSAGEFAPPADGPVAFRRDRIPLEPDAMAALSRQLEMLAGGLNAKTAADRRGAAQMLALALALDPGNAKARKRIEEYRNGRHQAEADDGRLEMNRRRIREDVAWLETPEAGPDGQALADCLKDVLVVSDPANRQADGLGGGEERGAWAGWIPGISEYEKKVVVADVKPDAKADAGEAESQQGIRLEKAFVQTPLWQRVGKSQPAKWVLAPAKLEMSARKINGPDEGKSGFNIVIGPSEMPELKRLGTSLVALLGKTHGALPQGVQISINSKEFGQSLQSNQRQSVSAAAAVLASAAITGREPDAIVIGQVDENGAFTLPTRFWYQLQALGPGNGQRLVLPADAAVFLPSILAMEKPEFFFDYEVLLAADFEQLLAFTAKKPEGVLASAAAKFHEIRDRKGKLGLRLYIDNGFVKQRLAAVLQDLPAHVSAKMLLVQTSGNRPVWVSRKVLAAELRRSLESVPAIKTPQQLAMDSQHLANVGETYEECRAMVDALERYTAKSDRDLLNEARDVTIAIRRLDKATRSKDEDYLVSTAVQAARAELKRLYAALDRKLASETGDGDSAIAR